jgi:hypothetical protein
VDCLLGLARVVLEGRRMALLVKMLKLKDLICAFEKWKDG